MQLSEVYVSTLPSSERVLKIGLNLLQVMTKRQCQVFLGHKLSRANISTPAALST